MFWDLIRRVPGVCEDLPRRPCLGLVPEIDELKTNAVAKFDTIELNRVHMWFLNTLAL